MTLKNIIFNNLRNIPGWTSKRRIVVFESDDWGAIRMSSKENKIKLEEKGFDFTNQDFNRFDALESNEDLSCLYQVLQAHTDMYGNHPIITAVSIVGNPDFDKIKKSGFKEYYWEPMSETCKRYPEHDKVCDLYKYGIANRIFYPVFHGREHLNAQRWLRFLQQGNKSVLCAFDYGITGISRDLFGKALPAFQAAFDLDDVKDLQFMEKLIEEGTDEFENLWGYRAKYFVPTNGPFNNSLEKKLNEVGIEYILGERVQREPQGGGKYKKKFHWIGKKNKFGQINLTRNGFFEPSIASQGFNIEPVRRCIQYIEDAFRWNKPAIISTHRLNYIGFIEPENREKNLELLDCLLMTILKKWPDVEFMNSVELGNIIRSDKK